jgi:hypothetical protein
MLLEVFAALPWGDPRWLCGARSAGHRGLTPPGRNRAPSQNSLSPLRRRFRNALSAQILRSSFPREGRFQSILFVRSIPAVCRANGAAVSGKCFVLLAPCWRQIFPAPAEGLRGLSGSAPGFSRCDFCGRTCALGARSGWSRPLAFGWTRMTREPLICCAARPSFVSGGGRSPATLGEVCASSRYPGTT